jgi:hypothetical protein
MPDPTMPGHDTTVFAEVMMFWPGLARQHRQRHGPVPTARAAFPHGATRNTGAHTPSRPAAVTCAMDVVRPGALAARRRLVHAGCCAAAPPKPV